MAKKKMSKKAPAKKSKPKATPTLDSKLAGNLDIIVPMLGDVLNELRSVSGKLDELIELQESSWE